MHEKYQDYVSSLLSLIIDIHLSIYFKNLRLLSNSKYNFSNFIIYEYTANNSSDEYDSDKLSEQITFIFHVLYGEVNSVKNTTIYTWLNDGVYWQWKKKLHVSAYSGRLKVETTFLLKEFYVICLNRVVMFLARKLSKSEDGRYRPKCVVFLLLINTNI